ncbi:MAG: AtpZ/AtpI family protein [Candidatus Poribacteria bacterium]|nr:AtpZ/AtpI family protein [Candidatus Poribacteria bacterium]
MGAVLELEDRSIRTIYLLTLCLTITVVVEALIKRESSTLPIFLIGSAIGFSLFWSIEFAARKVVLSEKTRQSKYLQGIIFFSRYTVLGGLFYFLFASIDIIFAIISCIGYFGSAWFSSKLGDEKRVTNVEVFSLASNGLIIVLAFCIGYFTGKWIGGYFGHAEIGSNIGLALGFAAALVQGFRMEKQRRDASRKAQDTKENNLLRLNNDSPLF